MSREEAKAWYDRQSGEGSTGFVSTADAKNSIDQTYNDMEAGGAVPTELSLGSVTANTVAITSDGGPDDVVLPEATTDGAGMLSAVGRGKQDYVDQDVTAGAVPTFSNVMVNGQPLAYVQAGETVFPAGWDLAPGAHTFVEVVFPSEFVALPFINVSLVSTNENSEYLTCRVANLGTLGFQFHIYNVGTVNAADAEVGVWGNWIAVGSS